MKMKRTLCGKLYAQRRYLSCTRCRHREVCRNETGIVLIKFRGSVAHPWSIKWRAHAYTVILCTKFTLSGTFLVCTVYIFEEKRAERSPRSDPLSLHGFETGEKRVEARENVSLAGERKVGGRLSTGRGGKIEDNRLHVREFMARTTAE